MTTPVTETVQAMVSVSAARLSAGSRRGGSDFCGGRFERFAGMVVPSVTVVPKVRAAWMILNRPDFC
jgi:hypothetical protein